MSANLTPQAYTFPSVTIQQLVFTAKRWGQFPSITYINGGTAGSEVVAMDSSFNITIKIASGTSTNAQIAAALAAAVLPQAGSLSPSDLCSAAPVSGHSTDTPTCYSVALAGGVAAVAASAVVGPLLVTANATGTGGNSKSVTLLGSFSFTVTTVTDSTHLVVSSTSGLIAGSPIKQGANSTTVTTVTDGTNLVVGSTTSWTGSGAAATSVVTPGSEPAVESAGAITVQVLPLVSPNTAAYSYTPLGGTQNPDIISASYSTWSNVMAALNAIVSVDCTATWQGHMGGLVSTNDLATYSLAGGLAAAAASTGSVNGVTCAANATGPTANGVTVTLIPGGTAGSEVVTDLSNGSFTCEIQSGTSTPTQVAAALNADASFTALYTASHTGVTGMQAVYQDSLSGAVGPDIYGWYSDSATTALTSSFVYFPFGGSATSFHVENDDASGSNTVIGSWDGVNNHFIIVANTQRDIQTISRPGVYLKYGTAAPAYKAWAVNR